MKKVLLILIFSLIALDVQGATWYVRSDGGDDTECDGTHDLPQAGATDSVDAGSEPDCAYEHHFWVFGVHANCDVSVGRRYSAGDTIILEDEAFMNGYGAPNTHAGASSFPYDCKMLPILGGADSNNRTKIYGRNYASCSSISSATELYAVERSEAVLITDGSSDHVDIRCLHITDHSECKYQSSLNNGDACDEGTYPFGDYGYKGLESSGTDDLRMDDVWITGMASEGASVDTPSNWELNRVHLWGNAGINWNFNGTGSSGTTDQATGTMTFTDGSVAWAGCTLVYPPTSSSYDGVTLYDPKWCCSQDQSCASDGLGSERNDATWSFDGTDFIHNVADGLDLLYHDIDGGSGSVTVKKSKFMANSGNQLKSGGNTIVYNLAVDANCNWFSGKSYTWEYSGDCSTWNGTNQSTCETGHAGCEWNSDVSQCLDFSDHCRAGGNAFAFAYQTGTDVYVEGVSIVNTVTGEPFLVVARNIANCAAGNLLVIKNGIFTTTNSLNWISVDGSCTSSTRTQDHSVIYGFTTNPTGTGNTYTNPGLSGTINGSSANFLLPSADDGADESTTYQPSTDMFDYARGASWDRGAIEYGSTDPGEGGGGGSTTKILSLGSSMRLTVGSSARIQF